MSGTLVNTDIAGASFLKNEKRKRINESGGPGGAWIMGVSSLL